MSIPRLQESVTFTYRPHPSELTIVPHFACEDSIGPKEIVFKLVLDEPDHFDDRTRGWAFSASVGSRYVYAPTITGGGIARLPEIRLAKAQSALRLVPVRWTGAGRSPADILSDAWSVRHVSSEADQARSFQVASLWERQ